jgi:hypothetical protein
MELAHNLSQILSAHGPLSLDAAGVSKEAIPEAVRHRILADQFRFLVHAGAGASPGHSSLQIM